MHGSSLTGLSRRAQTALLWASGFTVYWYILESVDDKEEELGPAVGHVHETRKADEKGEQAGEEGAEHESEVVVPDEPPEDAWFIPLGWARQCPPVLYKGSDPEWQSFVAFSKDRQRSLSIRSK